MLGINTCKAILLTINSTVAKTFETTQAVTKTIVTTVGASAAAKGAVDIAEDLICQDYFCLTIDCIGVCADLLTITTSFIPGPNITSVVTIPVSTGCKVFRWCCQKSFFKFGCKR